MPVQGMANNAFSKAALVEQGCIVRRETGLSVIACVLKCHLYRRNDA